MHERGSHVSEGVPRYRELPTIGPADEHHAWDFFGRGDELGTVNFLTAERVRLAARQVLDGRVVNLSLSLNVPDPPLSSSRHLYEHKIIRSRSGRDDVLTDFYPQGSSQWDGLQHIRYREFGYYGGRDEDDLDTGQLGIAVLARKGLVGRGVLVDVERYLRATGCVLRPDRRLKIGPELLEEVLAFQGCCTEPGDILMLRTGWMGWYLSLDHARRSALRGALRNDPGGLECPGLDPARETAEWLWDRQIAAAAADNPTLEALRVDPVEGFLHRRLIALLGMPIGEFFFLEELGDACGEAGRWAFLFVSAPLNIPNGVGSPCNSYAVLLVARRQGPDVQRG